MPLFKIEWKLATELAIYYGEYIVFADDSDHAIDRAKDAIGPESSVANISVSQVGDKVFELRRNEKLADCEVVTPMPYGSRELFAFEIAARANVIASSEKVAFERMCQSIKQGQSDGKYCTFLKTAVLEREKMSEMSRADKHALNKHFIRVQGGGVNPK